jgi:two-component system, sensor histidine kinase and response regulator
VELGVVHPLPLLREVVQQLDELALRHGAELRLPAALPAVRGYAPWIEQVWMNFVSNAIKYGGESPLLEIGGEPEPGGTVRLWVRDRGPGLDAAAIARLFQPFSRIAEVAGDGHGLGLSIVRRLVERMGGEVGCHSVPGAGSTFWFRLPAAD